MDKTNKVPDKKRTDILFSLSEPGGIGTAKLTGVLNHPLKRELSSHD
jgi:hypothetical protein